MYSICGVSADWGLALSGEWLLVDGLEADAAQGWVHNEDTVSGLSPEFPSEASSSCVPCVVYTHLPFLRNLPTSEGCRSDSG